MFDPPQPPPPPPAEQTSPLLTLNIQPPTLVKNKNKKAMWIGIGLVLIVGAVGAYNKPPKTSVTGVSTPTTKAVESGFTPTATQAWLLGNQESISKYLEDAGVYSTLVSGSTTPGEFMSNCSMMLTMVDDYYYASWKTEPGAPTSWIRLLNLMHDGLTYCAAGDFTRGSETIGKAAEEQGAFTDDIKAATP